MSPCYFHQPEQEGARLELLYHVDDGKRYTRTERYLTVLCFHITAGPIEGYSGKGGPHLQAPETCCCGGGLTNFQDSAADSASRPTRMDKEGAYLGRVVLRIEKSIFAARAVVTSIKRLALAPASATSHDMAPVHPGLRYKIGAILNQLCIHPKDQL